MHHDASNVVAIIKNLYLTAQGRRQEANICAAGGTFNGIRSFSSLLTVFTQSGSLSAFASFWNNKLMSLAANSQTRHQETLGDDENILSQKEER